MDAGKEKEGIGEMVIAENGTNGEEMQTTTTSWQPAMASRSTPRMRLRSNGNVVKALGRRQERERERERG